MTEEQRKKDEDGDYVAHLVTKALRGGELLVEIVTDWANDKAHVHATQADYDLWDEEMRLEPIRNVMRQAAANWLADGESDSSKCYIMETLANEYLKTMSDEELKDNLVQQLEYNEEDPDADGTIEELYLRILAIECEGDEEMLTHKIVEEFGSNSDQFREEVDLGKVVEDTQRQVRAQSQYDAKLRLEKMRKTMADLAKELSETNTEACPGCGSLPGEGYTPGCVECAKTIVELGS